MDAQKLDELTQDADELGQVLALVEMVAAYNEQIIEDARRVLHAARMIAGESEVADDDTQTGSTIDCAAGE
jgi:hypothetical protein